MSSALLTACATASAVQVGLAGVIGDKALLLIGGTVSRTLSVGQRTPEGVRLVAVEPGSATIEVDGERRVLRLGQNAAAATRGPETTILSADGRGHYITTGSVNGLPVRFVVDTGASLVSIGAAEAKRLGLDLTGATRGYTQTANGVTPVYQVRLDNVRVGSISMDGVDALVHESDMPLALLGMSFLNRTEMQNEGGRMTLKKRY